MKPIDNMSEQKRREEIVEIGRMMYTKSYISGGEGNISARLPDGNILITPSGLHKGLLNPSDIITVNLAGERVDTPNAQNAKHKPTSELPMHLEAYKQRDDVLAVVHAHPAHAVALSIAQIPIADDLIPEVVVFLGRIPVTPYATPSSEENAQAIRETIHDCDALVLERHGSLTVGRTLMEAFMRLEMVESSARLAYMTALLDVDRPIPSHQLAKLHAQRKQRLVNHKSSF